MASKKASSQKHYAANREAYIERAKAQKQKIREHLRAAKSRPCMDCGVEYPYYVMQFDHVRREKVCDLSTAMQRGMAIERVQAEIEKCEVVCANCHAIRTWTRLGSDAVDDLT